MEDVETAAEEVHLTEGPVITGGEMIPEVGLRPTEETGYVDPDDTHTAVPSGDSTAVRGVATPLSLADQGAM